MNRIIRRLNDVHYAKDISEMLDPDECGSNEIVCVRGFVKCTQSGRVEVAVAHCADDSVFPIVYARRDSRWQFEQGGSSLEAMKGIEYIIGVS